MIRIKTTKIKMKPGGYILMNRFNRILSIKKLFKIKFTTKKKERSAGIRSFYSLATHIPCFIAVLFAATMLSTSPIYGSDAGTGSDNSLIGTWSVEWGDLHYNSRSIELKPNGMFIDSSTQKIGNRKSSSTEISGEWEVIEGCVLKLTPSDPNSEHYFLYYRIEKRIFCYFSSSSLLRATEDGRLSSRDKTYRRQGKWNKNKTTIDGMWIDESTGAMAFSFYRNGSFVRRRLSNKSEQWSQIGDEFLLWEKARIFVKE